MSIYLRSAHCLGMSIHVRCTQWSCITSREGYTKVGIGVKSVIVGVQIVSQQGRQLCSTCWQLLVHPLLRSGIGSQEVPKCNFLLLKHFLHKQPYVAQMLNMQQQQCTRNIKLLRICYRFLGATYICVQLTAGHLAVPELLCQSCNTELPQAMPAMPCDQQGCCGSDAALSLQSCHASSCSSWHVPSLTSYVNLVSNLDFNRACSKR